MAEATITRDDLREHVQAAVRIIVDDLLPADFMPVKDRVLCKPMEREYLEKEGSLFVIRDTDNRARFNLVVGVGSTVEDITVGDIVLTGRYVGHPLEFEGESFRLTPAQDILGIYHGPDAR